MSATEMALPVSRAARAAWVFIGAAEGMLLPDVWHISLTIKCLTTMIAVLTLVVGELVTARHYVSKGARKDLATLLARSDVLTGATLGGFLALFRATWWAVEQTLPSL
ncbi:hypothetical protein [Dyella sp. 20L07]|uniref:hypothetical protein n=1 Tax=Dyella sp. 20L07 TaxID=3384240 RepID=UPI003D2D46E4